MDLYRLFLTSDLIRKVLEERENVDSHIILQLITYLRKIVNHPRLIYNYIMKNQQDLEEDESDNPEDEIV